MITRWFWPTVFILSLGVVILGATTRLFDAGLSCPDWPLCYGKLTVLVDESAIQQANSLYPDTPYDIFRVSLEYGHRVLATLLGICALSLVCYLLYRRKPIVVAPVLFLVLVVVQGVFGALTVTMKLAPWIVMTHLFLGFTTVSFLWIMTMRSITDSGRHDSMLPDSVPPIITIAIASALLAVIVQIILGGLVSTTYATLACTEFPKCSQQWLPQFSISSAVLTAPESLAQLQTIHVIHRIMALVVTLVLMGMIFLIERHKELGRDIVLCARFTMVLLLAQWIFGILIVFYARPFSIALFHHGNALLLLLALLYLQYKTMPNKIVLTV